MPELRNIDEVIRVVNRAIVESSLTRGCAWGVRQLLAFPAFLVLFAVSLFGLWLLVPVVPVARKSADQNDRGGIGQERAECLNSYPEWGVSHVLPPHVFGKVFGHLDVVEDRELEQSGSLLNGLRI